MKKLLNRKEALGMIDAIFTSLHFNLISIKDLGIENSKERDYFLAEAWKIDQGRLKKDYEQTVNSLDAIGFKEYYKLIGKFATKYKIGCWKEYNEYEPILVEELNEELRKYDKTEDKLELINSFTVDELQSESFIFDSKVQVLYDILDDFNVGNKKEEGINTVLESFNSSDKASFISKLQTDKNLLNALIDKVNGNEKNQLLTYLYKFLSSADGFGAEEYKLPPKAGFDAKYKKGKVIISTYYYIDRKISRYKYRYIEKNRELNPFTNVTFCYGNDQNEITVPAIVLVKSRGDVVLYDDFYKSNIDWKSLTEEKKRELYTEFVLHYLPKELGDAAVGNPITFLIMIIVGAVIAKAGAVIAACASLVGAGFSALNIIEGCKLISKSAEGYGSISDVNTAKVTAKELARGIVLLGVEVIPVLFGLIKRGIAKYNGKKIKVGETSRSLNETSFANQSQLDAVSDIKNPNVELVNAEHPHDYTMKSNYGEMKTDIDLEKNGGFQRVSNFRVTSLKDKGHHGIDGIYRNMNPPPDFIIVDSKYLGAEKAVNEAFAPAMSKVKSGRQMDSKWIDKNLADSIDDDVLLKEIQKAIRKNRVDSVAAKIDNTGKLTYYQLDSDGKVMMDKITNNPIIYNISKE